MISNWKKMEVVLTPKFRSTVKKLRGRYRNVTHDFTGLVYDLQDGRLATDFRTWAGRKSIR